MTVTTGSHAAVAVHPRIRSRRIEVLRDAGRRRLRRAVVVVGVACVLLAAAAVVRSPLLDVDEVATTGGDHTTAEQVRLAAGIGRGTPMVGLDTRAAERRVEALPWVADATVTRTWPGGVHVTIDERTAVATVPAGESRWAVVDAEGRVLDVTDVAPPGLPTLSGVAGGLGEGRSLPDASDDALTVLSALVEALPGGVAGVSTELDVTLGYGGVVRFGSTAELDDKVVALETVLARVQLDCLAMLDLRAPGSPALTRHEGCS
jgi:cell division protein FtsQ